MVPTFTATPDVPPTATPLPAVEVVDNAQPSADTAANDAADAPSTAPTSEPTAAPTDTPAPSAKFMVSEALVNVRSGPGTNYGLAGSVEAGQTFEIQGKNAQGDWLQICCVNGQVVWIFSQLGAAENVEAVAVAQHIPAVPTAAPTTAPVAAPTQAPAPTDTPAPAPPPAADPCAGIGGDGCKFKVREGPQFAPNGGSELKLQLFFIHSGIDGGQPQGSYFVVLMKDGQNLGVSDATRSIANNASEGALGRYNYEYKIGLDKLPGNTVAGNYTMFVLDGNGERDSQDLNFSVPEGQGEVRVVWDQG
ncbi:MAG: SH3 domain-containing protein [Caldilineaceae bacterium]|nr:SH3 domain-containing protein [Caldilineaceae bacterium]